ncbi:hypothetical protein FKM82_013348 [Ascaphus truei]
MFAPNPISSTGILEESDLWRRMCHVLLEMTSALSILWMSTELKIVTSSSVPRCTESGPMNNSTPDIRNS